VVGNSCGGGDRVPGSHKKTARRWLSELVPDDQVLPAAMAMMARDLAAQSAFALRHRRAQAGCWCWKHFPLQLGHTSGGPKQIDMLCTLEMLHSDFQGLLDARWSEECETTLSEGPRHQGRATVTRYVGARRSDT